ncbi:MAG: DNA-3-methyladenine glycosylase [Bacteroidota bacterium]
MILPSSFYLHEDVVSISKELLGKAIYSSIDGVKTGGIIVETEAYRAPDDRACHAYGNRRTNRTKTMFEKGGTLYVYISYGLHNMINVVTAQAGTAHAILIRAIEPTVGIEKIIDRRKHGRLRMEATNGPGKSAQALGVTTIHDGLYLCDESSDVWIEDVGNKVLSSNIVTGLRVGLSAHTGKDAYRQWRFYIKDNKWVSKPKVVKYIF